MQPEEFRRFRMLFILSFFNGIFLAFFYSIAVSLFIKQYGANLVPYAYLGAGVVGVIGTNFYLLFQRTSIGRRMYFGSTVVLALVLVGFIILYHMGEDQGGLAYQNLAFLMFVFSSSMTVITGLVFGGMTGALFDLRQAKRLSALISTGEISASVIGFFSISRILTLVPSPYMLLYVSAAGMVLVLVMMIYIFRKFPENYSRKLVIRQQADDSGKSAATGNLFTFLGNKHFLFVSLVAVLSIMATYFADFGLLGGIKSLAKDVVESEREAYIVGFVSIFLGFAKVAELVMAIAAARLVSQFGMRFGLAILPFAMVGAIVIAILTGTLVPGMPFLFFLFLALTRLFDIVLRKSIETPSFKVVYHSLPAHQKAPMGTAIEGIMKQFAIVIAAGFLIAATIFLQKDDSVNLLTFSICILPFIILWVFLSLRLFKVYREKLKEVLLSFTGQTGRSAGNIIALDGFEILEKKLQSPVDLDRIHVARLTGKMILPFSDQNAEKLLKDKNPDVRKATLAALSCAYGRKEVITAVKAIVDKPFDVEEAELARMQYSDLTTDPGSVRNLEELLDSKKETEWRRLIHIMMIRPQEGHNPILQRMLQSHNPFLRNSAIVMSPGWPQENIKSMLIDLFQIPEYTVSVAAVLPKFGNEIIEMLESLLRKEYSKTLHLRILEIYGRINTAASRKILNTHMDYQDLEIQMAVVRLFSYTNFKATPAEIPMIKQKIEAFSENLTWLLATAHDVSASPFAEELIKWLNIERRQHREVIMNLLSFIHDRAALNIILENMQEDKTAAENAFAMELLDNLVDDDVKRWVLPLFENIPVLQKVKKLHALFPQEELLPADRLREIINRDFVVTNNWLKALAIEAWLELEEDAPEAIYSALFHHAPLLYEVSLDVLQKSISPGQLTDLVSRITPKEKSETLKLMMSGKNPRLRKIDNARNLEKQAMYEGEYSVHLARLGGIMTADKVAKGEMIEFPPDSCNAVLVMQGSAAGYGADKLIGEGYLLQAGEWSVAHINADASIRAWYAKEDSVIMHADLFELILVLMNNNPIYRRFLANLKPEQKLKPEIKLGV